MLLRLIYFTSFVIQVVTFYVYHACWFQDLNSFSQGECKDRERI